MQYSFSICGSGSGSGTGVSSEGLMDCERARATLVLRRELPPLLTLLRAVGLDGCGEDAAESGRAAGFALGVFALARLFTLGWGS